MVPAIGIVPMALYFAPGDRNEFPVLPPLSEPLPLVALLSAMTWAKARSTSNVVEGGQTVATSSVVGGGGGGPRSADAHAALMETGLA